MEVMERRETIKTIPFANVVVVSGHLPLSLKYRLSATLLKAHSVQKNLGEIRNEERKKNIYSNNVDADNCCSASPVIN